MNDRTMRDVDDYLSQTFIGDDAVLARALERSQRGGLPPIAVSAVQGKLLHVLARSIGARRVLEVGTLGGYSAIWMGRAIAPGGTLVTLEIDERHASVARENVEDAGLGGVVQIHVAPALDSLARMGETGVEPFDFVFIDADKENNPRYLKWALAFSHPGTMIVVDNVVRKGRVLDADSDDPDVAGTRAVLELMSGDPRLCATALQTVGHKGYDGFAIALVVQ
jgi:predicted O-methyltransferase YrrM